MSSLNNSNFYTLSSFKNVREKGPFFSAGSLQADKHREQEKQTILLQQQTIKCHQGIKFQAGLF